MKIAGPSFEALRPLVERSFILRLADVLRTRYETLLQGIDDDVFVEMVERGVARARSHGLSWESSITTFVATMIAVGPAFDVHEKVREVLADRTHPVDRRIGLLGERLSDDDWEAARRCGGAEAWFPDGEGVR